MAKLTPTQSKRLREIADYVATPSWEYPAFWKSSRTDQALVKRGLIERVEVEKPFSGAIKMRVHLCRITPAGRAALQERE